MIKIKKITFDELYDNMVNTEGDTKYAVIVFTEDSFRLPYSEKSRSYLVNSSNKYFKTYNLGSSLFGSCLDGTDMNVRLDQYCIYEDLWKVDYCYMTDDLKCKECGLIPTKLKDVATIIYNDGVCDKCLNGGKCEE